MSLENNLRIILGSKSNPFKNIKAQQKLGILIKKQFVFSDSVLV